MEKDRIVLSGWEMMAEIKRSGNGVPVVLMSGRPIDLDDAKAQGFIHYEMKPVRMNQVNKFIEEYAKRS